jgi:hypothetical protein
MQSPELDRRRMQMHYPLDASCIFTVRCDPPYESDDGRTDETLVTVKRDAVKRALDDLLTNLDRLAPNQAPMIIEIRRTL